jgi:hypothetical protein
VNIRLTCPQCSCPGRLETPAPAAWTCPECDHLLRLADPAPPPALPSCAVCGNPELYRKKDFPHALGLGILTLACLASTITYGLYDKWLTWTILLGSAAFDGLLYLWVKDVLVCYRCDAQFRGLAPDSGHPPFELTVHERYRQERLRREQLAEEASGGRQPPDYRTDNVGGTHQGADAPRSPGGSR